MTKYMNGDVVVFHDIDGKRRVAIREGYGFAEWVVAIWGFRGMSDDAVTRLVSDGLATVYGAPVQRHEHIWRWSLKTEGVQYCSVEDCIEKRCP